jgi:hypothetical protein
MIDPSAYFGRREVLDNKYKMTSASRVRALIEKMQEI